MKQLNIKPEKASSAFLHLLLENNINIKAHTTLMIEMMCDNDIEKINHFSDRFAVICTELRSQVVIHLNALYGDLDLSDLLGDQ